MSLSTVPTQLKYGLVKKGGFSAAAVAKAPVRPKLNTFKDALEDDSEDEQMTDIGRVNAQLKKKNEQSLAKLSAVEASTKDADIYDYDGSYDTFKAAAVTSHPLSQPSGEGEPKSKYVGSLLVTAKMREREAERVYEKKLLKERKVEDELFGDQPKFVTAAYKQKLLEDQKWEYENKLAEQLEENTDVRKKGMQGFYSNLLTKNIAMGGNVENALSVYTAGSSRQHQVVNQETQSSSQTTTTTSQYNSTEKRAEEPLDTPESVRAPEPRKASSMSSVGKEVKSEPVVADGPVVKVEDVMSAKERYLARKRKLQEESEQL